MLLTNNIGIHIIFGEGAAGVVSAPANRPRSKFGQEDLDDIHAVVNPYKRAGFLTKEQLYNAVDENTGKKSSIFLLHFPDAQRVALFIEKSGRDGQAPEYHVQMNCPAGTKIENRQMTTVNFSEVIKAFEEYCDTYGPELARPKIAFTR